MLDDGVSYEQSYVCSCLFIYYFIWIESKNYINYFILYIYWRNNVLILFHANRIIYLFIRNNDYIDIDTCRDNWKNTKNKICNAILRCEPNHVHVNRIMFLFYFFIISCELNHLFIIKKKLQKQNFVMLF